MGPASGEDKRQLFRRLLRENGDKIYSFALGLVGNKDEAADMVSEAFARALRNFDRFEAGRNFHSWLFKIVQNIYIDKKRRLEQRKTVSIEEVVKTDERGRKLDDLWESSDPAPDEDMLRSERVSSVQGALGKIPSTFRDPLMLCDMFSMSYDQISQSLKLPVGTVRSRIFRGRQMLRDLMRSYVEGG